MAQSAQGKQAIAPTLAPCGQPFGPCALQSAPAGQDAGDIASLGEALDRRRQKADDDPAGARNEG
jgi:hypothetical protein